MKLAKILKACRVDKPEHFRLADYDPAETFGLSTNIEDVKLILADGVARLGEMQQRLYANGRWAVLVALQGMDAAGKDGVIKHVMSGINPQGCEVPRLQSSERRGTGARFFVANRPSAATARAYRHLQSLAL